MSQLFSFFRIIRTRGALAGPCRGAAGALRRAVPLLLAAAVLLTGACASNKAGLKSPELPARHWLDEVPGVPVENKGKLEAAIPNLYDPSKSFTFEDCVFLTIQQSPLLVNSAVDLEIKRVALTNAVWKYLPEPRMTLTVSNNLTRYNMDTHDTPGDYGRTKLRAGFYAAFPNPVATYFEHQVQKALVNVAISTHRKAVGEVIYKIAQSYLKLEAQRRLTVDAESANGILAGFDGHALKWEDRWSCTEDDLLLRAQVKLGDFNIMVAWAQYVPDMTLQINNYPPAGQYQPPSGQEDTFLHLNFDFPLIDWGRRYRDVQTARMRKAQAFHEMARKRTEYSNKWLQAEQRVALAETQLKLEKTRLDTAEMQYKEARISFDEGTAELPDMVSRQEAATNARIAYIQAELDYRLAQLEWMYLANLLQERFLGLPAKEIL